MKAASWQKGGILLVVSGVFFTRSMMAHTVQLSKMAGTGLTDTVTITPTY